jgi:hypothetical protein
VKRLLVLAVIASCAKRGPPCDRATQAAVEGIELARGATMTELERANEIATLTARYGCGVEQPVCCTKPPPAELPTALHDARFVEAARAFVAAPPAQQQEACARVNAALRHASITQLRARLGQLDAWRASIGKIAPMPEPDEPSEVTAARTLLAQCAAACAN